MSPKRFELRKKPTGSETREGLDAVVASDDALIEADEDEQVVTGGPKNPKVTRHIPIDRIRPNPFQKRLYFDTQKIEELSEGMKIHGWVGGGLPVRADPDEPNIYQLVFGERRWRAANLANFTAIPCEVSTYSDEDMTEIGLVENVQRENLTNYELGIAYKSLLDMKVDGKPKYSIRSLAKRLGFKDKSRVEDMLQYVRAPENVQELAKEQPNISPRMVHELSHIDEADRGAVIEEVRAGRMDIEDVRGVRKDLQTSHADRGIATGQEGTMDVSLVELPSPLAPSEGAERALVERRTKRDGERITTSLAQLSVTFPLMDGEMKHWLFNSLGEWEHAIATLKQTLQSELSRSDR